MVWADGLGLEDVLMAFAAAILDSGVRIGNRCKFFPGFWPWACSDSGFEGVNLGIAAGKLSRMALAMQ